MAIVAVWELGVGEGEGTWFHSHWSNVNTLYIAQHAASVVMVCSTLVFHECQGACPATGS